MNHFGEVFKVFKEFQTQNLYQALIFHQQEFKRAVNHSQQNFDGIVESKRSKRFESKIALMK